jgi:hypothetical protein
MQERKMDMDQRQKRISGPRFNIFDFLIILAIVACVTAIIARVIFVANRKEDIVFADVYFEVTGISEVTANALCVQNESIYLQSGDARIGLINNVRSEPCTVRTEDENGALIEAVHPDKKSVYGMAQIKGLWHEEGFVVEGMYLATVGSTLDIYTKYASCTITITSIEQK